MVSDINNDNFINETVVSEYLYFVLGFRGGASPRTLKEKRAISEIFSANENLTSILTDFSFIHGHFNTLTDVPKLTSKYNLLPNDAIILASCKIHNITKLASHDSDFILPCKAEGIELLREE